MSVVPRVFEVQAHRGGRSLFPENTLQAFCSAADIGIRVIELDLFASRDHQLLVCHDPFCAFPSPCGRQGRSRPLYSLPYCSIATLDCGRPDPAFPGQQQVAAFRPLLAEVFSAVDRHMAGSGLGGSMAYNLEVKSFPGMEGVLHPPPERYARLVLDAVHDAQMDKRVRIQSFDWRVVRAVRMLDRSMPTGLLVERIKELRSSLRRLGFVPRWVNPFFRLVDRRLVSGLHARGAAVIPWTLNSDGEVLGMLAAGVDGVITDVPERVSALLAGLQVSRAIANIT